MRKIVPVIVSVGLLGAVAATGFAQQPSMPSESTGAQSQATGAADQRRTIDCPPGAAQTQAKAGAVGTPQGTGTGSGLNAMLSAGAAQQVEGAITAISSTRTNRVVEVGNVKLEVEPDTVILVNCQPGSMAALQEGANVKASYEVKEPNRNVATAIETLK